jgi:hypothetical protein
VLDYITDDLEPTLTENLHLRSDGTAEDLAFYIWREPGGEWIGGMGGYE